MKITFLSSVTTFYHFFYFSFTCRVLSRRGWSYRLIIFLSFVVLNNLCLFTPPTQFLVWLPFSAVSSCYSCFWINPVSVKFFAYFYLFFIENLLTISSNSTNSFLFDFCLLFVVFTLIFSLKIVRFRMLPLRRKTAIFNLFITYMRSFMLKNDRFMSSHEVVSRKRK